MPHLITKVDAAMSKLSLACALAVTLIISAYPPDASAVKVVRDATPPTPAVPPPRVATATPVPANLPTLSATQIVDKNVTARGGLTTWRAIHSMTVTGKLDAGGRKDTLLPYTLQVKRPNKQRLAIDFAGHTALQVFDGNLQRKERVAQFVRQPPRQFAPSRDAFRLHQLFLLGGQCSGHFIERVRQLPDFVAAPHINLGVPASARHLARAVG